MALDAPFDVSNLSAAISKHRSELTKLLAESLLAASYWVSLAAVSRCDNVINKALGDLTLSILMRPNEGYGISQRAVFGLFLWEALAKDLRQRLATDLLVVPLPDTQRDQARAILTAKPADTRQDMLKTLEADGVSQERLASIGLRSL